MNKGFLKAGLKIIFRRYFSNPEEFKGDATQICEQILEKSWNGEYYQTGLGHFNYFWIRDFGVVADSLITIGNLDRVQKTIEWALSKYMRANKIALCINSRGDVFDAPKKSIDALPWLIYSIAKSGYKISNSQREFLQTEINRFQLEYLDPETGDIIDGVLYSELRDAVRYRKSSYTVMMLLVMVNACQKLKLEFRHSPENYRKRFGEYWNGKYFRADIDNDAFSAESNLLPFVLGVESDISRIRSILDYISTKRINLPSPMRYTDSPKKFNYHLWGRVIMPNYAGSTIWTWMGAIYLQLLKQYQPTKLEINLRRFEKVVTRYGNFPELLHPNGEWYSAPLYRGDEGMVWAALYLALKYK